MESILCRLKTSIDEFRGFHIGYFWSDSLEEDYTCAGATILLQLDQLKLFCLKSLIHELDTEKKRERGKRFEKIRVVIFGSAESTKNKRSIRR